MASRSKSSVPLGALMLLIAVSGSTTEQISPPTDSALRRESSSALQEAFWVEELTSGLDFPSSMKWLPDGAILIAERMGGLRILRDGKLEDGGIGGVPKSVQSGRMDGLRDVALDPDFAENRRIFLLISEGDYASRHAALYRGVLRGERLEQVARIFRSKDEVSLSDVMVLPCRLHFLPDKTLLLTTAATEFKERAQRLDSHMGKVLRLDRDGHAPPDNPFLGRQDALPEIWTYGHRLVIGLFQDPRSGELWTLDTGPRGGDELNLLKSGANYGWPSVGQGFSYANNGAASPKQTAPGVENPVLLWIPSPTPSSLVRYEATALPQWRGDFFISELNGKAIERIRFDARRRPIQRELLLTDLDERFREVTVGPDGFIYVLTDHQSGRLLRVRPGAPGGGARVAAKLATPYAGPDMVVSGDPESGAAAFAKHCAACHRIGSQVPGGEVGPDLNGVMGRPIASVPNFPYSEALKAKATWGGWTRSIMDRLLFDPNGFAEGTTMAAPRLTDAKERGSIIVFLDYASRQK